MILCSLVLNENMKVYALGLEIANFMFGVLGFVLWVEVLGFKVQGSRFRVHMSKSQGLNGSSNDSAIGDTQLESY